MKPIRVGQSKPWGGGHNNRNRKKEVMLSHAEKEVHRAERSEIWAFVLHSWCFNGSQMWENSQKRAAMIAQHVTGAILKDA